VRRELREDLEGYFGKRFATYGATAPGVDWPNAERQTMLFEQLLKVAAGQPRFSLLDYGCGYGALASFLDDHGFEVDYVGFDIASSLIAYATETYGGPSRRFVTDEDELPRADFVVASGVFNVRFGLTDEEWTRHVLETLDRFDALSTHGFAFNMLTSYSEPEKMRADLYYGDGPFFFDVCKRRYARDVALLHDYGLWEWTMLVRKSLP
jgi:SAM-dependent methyltransferase